MRKREIVGLIAFVIMVVVVVGFATIVGLVWWTLVYFWEKSVAVGKRVLKQLRFSSSKRFKS